MTRIVAMALLVSFGMLHPHVAAAQNEPVWPVKDKLVGKGNEKAKDVSGIACTSDAGFPRACLVIDDNMQSAQFATLKDGQIVAGKSIRLIDDKFEGKALELDGEDVAYANGFFYVVGSHGHPRDKDRKLDPIRDAAKIRAMIAATSQVIRIRVRPATGQPFTSSGAISEVPELTRTAKLKALIAVEPTLAPFVDKRLEGNGVTI